MATLKTKKKIERWRLYRTLEASTRYTMPGAIGTTTPYADTYRQVFAQLTDELLIMTTDLTGGVKLHTQEMQLKHSDTHFEAVVKLYIYIKA